MSVNWELVLVGCHRRRLETTAWLSPADSFTLDHIPPLLIVTEIIIFYHVLYDLVLLQLPWRKQEFVILSAHVLRVHILALIRLTHDVVMLIRWRLRQWLIEMKVKLWAWQRVIILIVLLMRKKILKWSMILLANTTDTANPVMVVLLIIFGLIKN